MKYTEPVDEASKYADPTHWKAQNSPQFHSNAAMQASHGAKTHQEHTAATALHLKAAAAHYHSNPAMSKFHYDMSKIHFGHGKGLKTMGESITK